MVSLLRKGTIPIISELVMHTLNRSFDRDIVPQEMKTPNVIPIHKAADWSLLKIIDLLVYFQPTQILEQLMYNKLVNF